MTTQPQWEKTILAKSDQLNADDLIGGDLTIKITAVKVLDTQDQPAIINYEGDNGKPFKPCKTVRKLIMHAWGKDERNFVGRSMRLYRDPTVKWAGEEVGGIRLRALSHIDRRLTISLQISKGRKIPIAVDVLKPDAPAFTEAQLQAALNMLTEAARQGTGALRDAYEAVPKGALKYHIGKRFLPDLKIQAETAESADAENYSDSDSHSYGYEPGE